MTGGYGNPCLTICKPTGAGGGGRGSEQTGASTSDEGARVVGWNHHGYTEDTRRRLLSLPHLFILASDARRRDRTGVRRPRTRRAAPRARGRDGAPLRHCTNYLFIFFPFRFTTSGRVNPRWQWRRTTVVQYTSMPRHRATHIRRRAHPPSYHGGRRRHRTQERSLSRQYINHTVRRAVFPSTTAVPWPGRRRPARARKLLANSACARDVLSRTTRGGSV